MNKDTENAIVVIALLVILPLSILFFTVLYKPLAGMISLFISILAAFFIYSYSDNKDVIVIEGIVLLSITLISLSFIVFAPKIPFSNKSTFQEALGIILLFLGYPCYRIVRFLVSVIKENRDG